jgi:carbon starvation protein CstA
MTFYHGAGPLNEVMKGNNGNVALVVNDISHSLLGKIGGALALLGVVAAPLTSGDTAFRSARLIIADFLKFNQRSFKNRLFISIPLFAAGFVLTRMDFSVIWRYFAWSNQTLATIVLWTITVYLAQENKFYWITLVPSLFMTVVITSYLLFAPEGFGLPYIFSVVMGFLTALAGAAWFFIMQRKMRPEIFPETA